ncbi:GntR family transcriptional regulator [Actinacidiphila soli]|uniref:GntR family transcriptional regulator n=1 Tax=Actinacidiphila soli TaxID=2487275 RepID=UPI001F0C70CD|nr:winged helix-turn-helix domain-containing protein [Actinacidiphila soli]
MSVATDDPRPKAIQIADTLRKEIATTQPGKKLQSLRELAERFGTTPVTVTSGLKLLMDEGLIFSVPNRGYFVKDNDDASGMNVPVSSSVREEITAIHSELRRLAARVATLEERAEAGSA